LKKEQLDNYVNKAKLDEKKKEIADIKKDQARDDKVRNARLASGG